ncbi:MAG: hypothetical protein IJ991_17560 [Thermoguttaceae bacterium]|nr:hypothetical protein [Thermoguttaceae bacterium]
MTLETKNERNDETTDVWEALLTRRLADDLDAFLETASDETFLRVDETHLPRRQKRNVKRLRFKTLATVAASLAALVGVAATVRFYVAAPKPNVVETARKNGETSLLAWSVAIWDEAKWARLFENDFVNVDVLGLYASSEAENEAPEEASPELSAVAGGNAPTEESAAESESSEWFSVETLSDVATSEPLKYEPFLQVVVASLR